jgi:hypothetical protein
MASSIPDPPFDRNELRLTSAHPTMPNLESHGDLPHIRVRANEVGAPIDIPELVRYRDLLLTMADRDLRVRYKQTVLGVVWVVLQPLLASLIAVPGQLLAPMTYLMNIGCCNQAGEMLDFRMSCCEFTIHHVGAQQPGRPGFFSTLLPWSHHQDVSVEAVV